MVSDATIKRVNRYNSNQKVISTLLGEIFVRLETGRITGIAYKELDIVCDTYGKPYFDKIEKIYFNISHTEEYIVCAISNQEIGIDMEYIEKLQMSIAKRFFVYNEIIYSSVASSCIQKDAASYSLGSDNTGTVRISVGTQSILAILARISSRGFLVSASFILCNSDISRIFWKAKCDTEFFLCEMIFLS